MARKKSPQNPRKSGPSPAASEPTADSNTAPTIHWNLLTDSWMEVMSLNAEQRTCSPLEALEKASDIHCPVSSSPLDLFATYRFLLTLLYWKASAAGGVASLRKSLLEGEMPSEVVQKIKAASDDFQLFSVHNPFLQDPSLANAKRDKPIGSLFAEFATGINLAHFHHGDDAAMRLCLPCVSRGMIRVVPWTQSGGSGLTPAIHGAPPIAALAEGRTLAVSLGLNLVPLKVKAGDPQWTGCFDPTPKDAAIPYLEAFTWNPRRILLSPAVPDGVCWGCGEKGVPVLGPLAFCKNKNTAKDGDGTPFAWTEPAAFYDDKASPATLKSLSRNLAARGADLQRLAMSEETPSKKPKKKTASPPKAAVVEANPNHQGWSLIVPCTTGSNNKTFDHRKVDLPNFSPETIRSLLPGVSRPAPRRKCNGWQTPRNPPEAGADAFVRTAVRHLTDADWAELAAAAYREMHHSPAAFDIMTGLYWALRKSGRPLPSRKTAWLLLKLMAAVPRCARVVHDDGVFNPLYSPALPKTQPSGSRANDGVLTDYPVAFPSGHRLEIALRASLEGHLRRRTPEPIDWVRFCRDLDHLLR